MLCYYNNNNVCGIWISGLWGKGEEFICREIGEKSQGILMVQFHGFYDDDDDEGDGDGDDVHAKFHLFFVWVYFLSKSVLLCHICLSNCCSSLLNLR